MRWSANWLRSEKAPVFILLLAVIFSLPALFCGWTTDDFLHYLMLTGRSPVPRVDDFSLFGLFSLISGNETRINKIIDLGAYPWWADLHTKVAFFRPIAELTHAIDYKLWPNTPLLMHVHNILWYVVLMFFAYRCFKLIFQNDLAAAALALLLYAVDGSNGMTMAWIANRNALIATTFALAAFWFHIRNRTGESTPVWAAPLLFLFSLLSAEYGIAVLAFLFSYAIFIDRASVRERIVSLLPYLVILIAWAIFYKANGFGTQDSGLYLDPIRQPAEYFSALPARLILLTQAQLNAVPLLFGQAHTSKGTFIKLGFILLTLLFMLPTLIKSNTARFFLFGAVLALFPVAAAYPEDRILLFSGFGFFGLLSEFFINWFDKSKRPLYPFGSGFIAGFFTWILVILHLVLSPLFFIPSYELPYQFGHTMVEQPAVTLPYDDSIKDKTAVFLNPPIAMIGSYFSAIRLAYNLPNAENTYFLACGEHDVRIERVAENALRITPDGGFLQKDFDYYARSPHNLFKVGDRLHLTAMDITITQVGPIGQPTQAIFTFKTTLEDPSLVWIGWHPGDTPGAPGEYKITRPDEFAEH